MSEAYLLAINGGVRSRVICVNIDAGSSVVATSESLTREAIYKNGQYLIRGVHDGDWTITATKDGQTTTQTVKVNGPGRYDVALTYFMATIEASASKSSTFTLSGPESQTGSGTSYTFTVKKPGSYTVTATNGSTSYSETVNVTEKGKTYSAYIDYRLTPEFSYSGSYQLVNDSNSAISDFANYTGNWKIKFKTSGTFNITNMHRFNGKIDLFLVGGGGGGGGSTSYPWAASGGGGGRTNTVKNISITNTSIVVGGGGAGGTSTRGGGSGGQSSAFGYSANGGGAGWVAGNMRANGGSGGSGGGANGGSWDTRGGNGGSDGGNGGSGYVSGGSGQGSTTKEFGTGTQYAGGGGGGCRDGAAGSGGSGGGGSGGRVYSNGSSGSANTGGGGGGRGEADVNGTSSGSGGSGIVIIRNAR